MKAITCGVATCPNPHSSRGYCSGHAARLVRLGDVQADRPLRERRVRPKGTICSVETCNEPQKVRGWCVGHYRRVFDTGELRPEIPLKVYKKPGDQCLVDDCVEPSFSRGWCNAHYTRHRKTGDVDASRPIWRSYAPRGLPCVEPRCDKLGASRGMCSKHYSQFKAKLVAADPVKREALKAYHRAQKKAEYARDPNIPRLRAKLWRQANPAKFRAIRAKYRLRLDRAQHIPFTDDQLRAKIAFWGDRCWMCHGPYDAVDHVKPLSKGGWHALLNSRPACRPCNSSKSGRWPYPVTGRQPRMRAA